MFKGIQPLIIEGQSQTNYTKTYFLWHLNTLKLIYMLTCRVTHEYIPFCYSFYLMLLKMTNNVHDTSYTISKWMAFCLLADS